MLLNAALTGVLGLAFWASASRFASADAIGSGAAWIGGVMTVSSIGQLNAYLLLPSFLSRAGNLGRRLLLGVYAATVPVSGLLGWAYWVFLAPQAVRGVAAFPAGGLVFVASVMLWTVFTLQDAGLVGARLYGALPLENGVYGLAKVALLFALSGTGVWSVVLATTLPLVVLVPAVNVFLVRRLDPRGLRAPSPDVWSGFARMGTGDWLATSAAAISTAYLPVLVVQLAGARAGAAFAVVWALAQAVDVAIGAVALSATVEIVAAPHLAAVIVRATIMRLGVFALTASLVVLGFGHLLLGLYSPAYVDPGATILVLLTLATIPRAASSVALALARARRRVGDVLLIQLSLAALVVPGVVLLVPEIGVFGGAWAWLAAQLVVGLIAVVVVLPRAVRAVPAAGSDEGPYSTEEER